MYINGISRSYFLEREMFQTKFVEEIKTHLVLNFFRKSCCWWGTVEKYVRAGQAPGNSTVRHMCLACWIKKATNIYAEYVMLITFSQCQWLREPAW